MVGPLGGSKFIQQEGLICLKSYLGDGGAWGGMFYWLYLLIHRHDWPNISCWYTQLTFLGPPRIFWSWEFLNCKKYYRLIWYALILKSSIHYQLSHQKFIIVRNHRCLGMPGLKGKWSMMVVCYEEDSLVVTIRTKIKVWSFHNCVYLNSRVFGDLWSHCILVIPFDKQVAILAALFHLPFKFTNESYCWLVEST